MIFHHQYNFVARSSVQTRSAPGYRITKYIDPVNFTHAHLATYYESQNGMKANVAAKGGDMPDNDYRYHVRVYIYCSPCVCQINTALHICRYRDKKGLVDFVVRIDHHLKACCSAPFSRVDGLVSVIDYIKAQEQLDTLADWDSAYLGSIDREWVEQQIVYYTEEDHSATPSPASQLRRIAGYHRGEKTCAAIVMLGEADYTIPLMGAPPLPPLESGPLPRETYIFKHEQNFSQPRMWYWDRMFIGTYTPSKPLPSKRPAPVGSETVQRPENTLRTSKRPRSSTSDATGS